MIDDIYELAEALKNRALGDGTETISNDTDLVSFGDKVVSSATDKEAFYSTLIDVLGSVIVSVRTARKKDRGTARNEFEWGAILQKINFEVGSFTANTSMFDSTDGQSDPYDVEPNAVSKAQLYKAITHFEYTEVIPDAVLVSTAFKSADGFNAFISGLYQSMDNAWTIALNALESNAINKGAFNVINNATTDGNELLACNVLDLYNRDVLGLECTLNDDSTAIVYPSGWVMAKDCFRNEGFCAYLTEYIKSYLSNASEFSTLFNIKGHGTQLQNPVFEIISKVATQINIATRNVYHKDVVGIPSTYNEVNWWDKPNDATSGKLTMDTITSFAVSDWVSGVLKTHTVKGVFAMIRDGEAVSTIHYNRRSHALYNPASEVTNIWQKCELGYAIDQNEVFHVMSVADPTIVSSAVAYNRYSGGITVSAM